jgi:hypothetical protein
LFCGGGLVLDLGAFAACSGVVHSLDVGDSE